MSRMQSAVIRINELLSESVVVSLILVLLVLSGHADGSLAVVVIGLVHTVPAVVDGVRMDKAT